MKTHIKAVMFDMGGVITDSAFTHFNQAIREQFHIDDFDFRQKKYTFVLDLFSQMDIGKLSVNEFWSIFHKSLNLPYSGEDIAIFNQLANEIELRHEVISLIKELKNKSLRIVLLSNTFDPYATISYEKGFYDMFDDKILSHEVGFHKPDKEIYMHALKVLKLQPEEIIFIDDSKENIDSAIDVGIKGIVYSTFEQCKKDLENYLLS